MTFHKQTFIEKQLIICFSLRREYVVNGIYLYDLGLIIYDNINRQFISRLVIWMPKRTLLCDWMQGVV